MTSSRLDRLFILLESGSSVATRNAAARQLGEVQRLHPHELHSLLSRVASLLRSSAWETRVAAAEAVRAILATLPPWTNKNTQESKEELLSFSRLDLRTVLSNSSHLMGSEGQEYDLQEEDNKADIKEKIAGQRKALCTRLGLDGALGLELANELFTTEDLAAAATISSNGDANQINKRKPVAETLNVSALSSREMNRIRRKSRLLTKQRTEDGEPPGKKIKTEEKVNGDDPILNSCIPISGGSEWSSDSTQWPLTWFCEQLASQLFSVSWESRHGAATALRELVVTCGKFTPVSILEDLAVRLVCVLALDRFGDFVGDAVVAPVRETSAQALGAVLSILDSKIVMDAAKALIELTKHEVEWQARHGALLGLRYALAIPKTSWINELLPLAYTPICEALSDPVEDVSAAAASSLLPVSTEISKLLPKESLFSLVAALWKLLGEQDELAAACNSHMALLAALLRDFPEAAKDGTYTNRLWPFLGHGTTAVRRAALQTLSALADAGEGEIKWDPLLLQEALRRVYERALVEHVPDVRHLSEKVWRTLVTRAELSALLHASCPFVSNWLCLSMQPQKIPIDPQNLTTGQGGKYYIGGGETVPQNQREINSIEARCGAARMLGLLSKYIVLEAPGVVYTPEMESPINCYVKILLVHLQSRSALQRTQIGLVVSEWAKVDPDRICPEILAQNLQNCLSGPRVYWDEIASSYTRLIQEAKDFTASLKHYNIPTIESCDILTLEQLEQLGKTELTGVRLKPKVLTTLEERKRGIAQGAASTVSEMNMLSIRTLASLAGAVVNFRCLPPSLNPIVRPLMEAVKREKELPLQELSAENLSNLVKQCIPRDPNPNGKIVSNLSTFLRCDPDTPKLDLEKNDNYNNIVMLVKQQQQAEKGSGGRGRGPGRPPIDAPPPEEVQFEDENLQLQKIQKRGAALALQRITSNLGSDLPTNLPKLWELIILDLTTIQLPSQGMNQVAEEIVGLLQVLEICLPAIHSSLLPDLMERALPKLFELLTNVYSAIRHMAARCLAATALLNQIKVMELIVEKVLPLLGAVDCDAKRQGAVEAISCVVEALQFKVVPYVVLLVVPLMGRMSDQNKHVRLAATHSFAQLVQLVPLDGAVPEPPDLANSASLKNQREKDRAFLAQLLHPTSIPDFVIPIKIQASLRSYQQAGVNWLAFLNRYKLHGILCDDMGLGKTLQSICILAGDHYNREQSYKLTKSPDCAPLPSLVICPPTLTGHWCYEVEKFLPEKQLRPLQYAGTPSEREKLRKEFNKHNLIVASYDIVRKDINFFHTIKWNYCILDEGHVIKNGRTRTSMAIKQLVANHRLILSGTPIQNNVLELWSLFDFLMPGFLGTEKQFTAQYSRPILASRDPKSSAREQELGALAMETLHRQVLPFLLRRMKEDVLDDLPPKITQDYYCELSSLQVTLYEDFAKEVDNQLEGPHVFQALRYLQNVCNHPKLVLTQAHPQYEKLRKDLQTPLDDISHAAKLPALKQLLTDCGIGFTDEPVCTSHRALVFCQLKAMLDIVENDLLRKHMPNVTYLRLDGSIPPTQRHDIVKRFNSDPSIDVLLLTTQVGGLGLNLTGADTVIFVEHDWNPMRDLQAMDRAHRIGQKKVVNVYRLITRGTLEEKIMGLQKFKVQTANTVISSENSRLETMGTEGLLELFGSAGGSISSNRNSGSSGSNSVGGGSSVKALLESLPELWDQGQYDEEYDMSTFVEKLKTAQS